MIPLLFTTLSWSFQTIPDRTRVLSIHTAYLITISSTVRVFDQQVAWGLDEAAAPRCTQETRVDDVQLRPRVCLLRFVKESPNTGRTK
jgi:hypothetical protein